MSTFTGGAMIGWVNVSWPLATLRVESDKLEVAASFVGTHRFKHEDVVDVVRVTWVPVLAWGVRIRHVRDDIPGSVIFWSLGNPTRILDAVSQAGFVPRGPKEALSRSPGFPFRLPFVLVALGLWNGLFLFDRPWATKSFPGSGALLGMGLIFAASLLVRRHGLVQRVALISPDALPRVRGFLNVLTLTAGLALAIGGLMAFLNR